MKKLILVALASLMLTGCSWISEEWGQFMSVLNDSLAGVNNDLERHNAMLARQTEAMAAQNRAMAEQNARYQAQQEYSRQMNRPVLCHRVGDMVRCVRQ